MAQDFGPEESADEIVEPADEDRRKRRPNVVRAWITLILIILIVLLLLCQFLGNVAKLPSSRTTTAVPVSPGPAIPGGPPTPDRTVSVNIHNGPTVPDVVGMSRSAAIGTLAAAHYRASVMLVYGLSVPDNTVLHQNPSAGSALKHGKIVGLLVQRRAKATGKVPGVTGLTQAEATRRVKAAGFKVTISYSPVTRRMAVGHVFTQWPLGGDVLEIGRDVQLQIVIKP